MLTVQDANQGTRRLLPGSLLWRKDVNLGIVDHYGILLHANPPLVAHIEKEMLPNAGPPGHLRTKIEAYEEFAAGSDVTAEAVERAVPVDVMWNRVQAVSEAKKPFGLMAFGESWNCESFARFVRDGIAHSVQAQKGKEALAILGVVGIVFLLVAVASEG